MPVLSHFRGSGKSYAKFIFAEKVHFQKMAIFKDLWQLISMDRKDYYNEKFELHIHWNSNEIIAILGNFLNYKIWHILLEHFNSVSANYKPFIPEL